MGGYRPLRILEDLDFTRRLQALGRPALIRVPLRTSGRRFLAGGPLHTFLFIAWLVTLHTLRLNAQRYADGYHGPADRTPDTQPPRPFRQGVPPVFPMTRESPE
jgi:hypothetical protein